MLWITFLVAISWPGPDYAGLRPGVGLDEGWFTALNVAQVKGLHWGSDIVFTYGPLGFLGATKGLSAQVILFSILYTAVVITSFYSVIAWQLHRRYGAITAIVGSFAMLSLLSGIGQAPLSASAHLVDIPGLTAFMVGISLLVGEIEERIARWLPAVFGSVAAIEILIKSNTGIFIVIFGLLLTGFSAHRLRRLGELLAAFTTVFLLVWVALSQPLRDIPVWFVRSASVVAGYASAMNYEDSSARRWEYAVAALLLGVVLLLGAIGMDLIRDRRGWPIVVFAGIATWFYMKEGFIRHDNFHSIGFFLFLLILVIALPWRFGWRIHALVTFVLVSFVFLEVSNKPVRTWFRYQPPFSRISEEVRAGISSRTRNANLRTARANDETQISVPAPILELLGDNPVHVDSADTEVAWLYDLNWRPVPVFQSYSAYTHLLDSANASRLIEPDGPTRVLRRSELAIDGRYRLQESPEYTLALVCNFTQIAAGGGWQLLARVGNHCGPAIKLGDAPLVNGRLVDIPGPSGSNMLVVGRIHLAPSISSRIIAFLFKPKVYDFTLDDAQYRLIAGTAEGPMLLRLPASLGWSPQSDQPINTNRIGLDNYSGSASISFYEIALS